MNITNSTLSQEEIKKEKDAKNTIIIVLIIFLVLAIASALVTDKGRIMGSYFFLRER